MAMKRKRVYSRLVRRSYKRRRTGVYRRRLRRVRGAFLQAKRSFYAFNWAPNTTTTDGFWKYTTSKLNDLPSYLEFVNLFDLYRIKALKFTLRPKYDSFAGNDTTDTTLPGITNQGGTFVHVCKDKYSNVSPSGTYTSTTLNTYLEQGNVRTYRGLRPINIYVRAPVVDMPAGAGNKRVASPWLQTADYTTVHRGTHIFMQDPAFNGTFGQSFDVFVTLYMQFKNLR